MNKRLLSLILCMAFIVSSFAFIPHNVFAESGKCGDNLTWSIVRETDMTTLVIEGSGAMYDYDCSAGTDESEQPPWIKQRTSIDIISISDDVTHIGNYAFCEFTQIKKPTLPSKLESIGGYAFYKCSQLQQIKFNNSNNLTEIRDAAFYQCTTLNNVNLPESLTSLGNHVFRGCTSLSTLTLSSGLLTIGQRAFEDCTKLTSVKIPDTVKSVGAQAFYNCTNLETLILGKGSVTLGQKAFGGCTALSSVDFADANVNIGIMTFMLCSNLSNLTNMTDVNSIGVQAFYGCTKLESITIPASVSSIGAAAFSACLALKEINVEPENKNYASINGNLFDKDITILYQYALAKKAGVYVIPETVDAISALAFAYCNLKSLGISKNITTIGQDILSHSNGTIAYYEGTEDDWANTSVHLTNADLTDNLIYETPVYGAISDVTSNNGTVTVTAEYAFGKGTDCLVYAGIYDENGVLIDLAKANKAESEFTFNNTEVLPGYTARLFYWDNETDLKPIGITTSLKI